MVATLQDLTESSQKSKPSFKKRPTVNRPTVRRFGKGKREEVAFDEDARREYLTGFSRRKQQRKQHAEEVRQSRIREEIKQSRRDAAQARKEQAAENVRAERRALGLLSDDDEADEPQPDSALHEEHDFEDEERHAHVTVQEFDADDDWNTSARPATASKPSPQQHKVSLPKDSAAKKESKPKKAKQIPTQPFGSLTSILEPEVVQAKYSIPIEEAQPQARVKKDFHYMSSAERAQERKHQRERNHQQAEIRREANRTRIKAGTPRKKISATGKKRK
ncbi:hypothetical protein MYAM1_003053 [Malassezia yamatoensis]|uniref:Nucleolar protein 12 n=1 Tax=Malassezia yamatoensis TaxID=253288 RepID=A0AAJ6CHW4_9BASI|nr:hypothetical protein MYAM1_003053 [Malassezia yamatoensis]